MLVVGALQLLLDSLQRLQDAKEQWRAELQVRSFLRKRQRGNGYDD